MTDKKAKIIKVENKLIKKAGYGELPESVIARSETVIGNNNIDFRDIAEPILSRLRFSIAHARQTPDEIASVTKNLINPVMELKANGSMFKYDLIGQLASIMLSFLEHIKDFNHDALEIIEAHEKTLTLIVTKQIKGDGGKLGAQLVEELESACSRYYRKNPDKF